MNEDGLPVGYQDIAAAARQIAGVANKTPVLTSRTVDARVGSRVFFKCENFQRTGSFKFRGAYNAMSRLSADERRRGVITSSSGNHAQAVALAGRLLGIRATIVMPPDASEVKRAATHGYGAEIVTLERTDLTLEEFAAQLAAERGLLNIHPFDHPHVIAGQGTVGAELFEQAGPLDLLLVPCGGGGQLSGCALAARALAPACRVVGIEPETADHAARSLRTKTLQAVRTPATIADGARVPSLGQLTFRVVLECVSDIGTVSDASLRRAMSFIWERMKLVVEPTGALAAAALLEGAITAPGARVGVVLSGGNVDLSRAGQLLAAG
jgi:threonine dehydratase